MSKVDYIQLSESQIDKVGNALIYLAHKIPHLSKTKALKLIYILDEMSIKKSGVPYFNLIYKVWKFGPVSEEIFIDLSSEVSLLKKYISKQSDGESTQIQPLIAFCDDEFSDNDMELLDYVIDKFSNKTAKELVSHTHRPNSPWYITAYENKVLDLLNAELTNNTEFLVDMTHLIKHDDRKMEVYHSYTELF